MKVTAVALTHCHFFFNTLPAVLHQLADVCLLFGGVRMMENETPEILASAFDALQCFFELFKPLTSPKVSKPLAGLFAALALLTKVSNSLNDSAGFKFM